MQPLLLRLKASSMQQLHSKQQQFANFSQKLHTLSPLATLERGYALVQHQGHVITDASKVFPGNIIEVRLAQGGLSCQVEKVLD